LIIFISFKGITDIDDSAANVELFRFFLTGELELLLESPAATAV